MCFSWIIEICHFKSLARNDNVVIFLYNLNVNKMKRCLLIDMAFASLTISAIILVISCTRTEGQTYDRFENHERDIIHKYNISQKIIFKIGLDTSGNSLWKRTEGIEFYNKEGVLTLSLNPRYLSRDPFPQRKSGEGMSLDELSNIEYLTETNIPNGNIDTTFCEYDDHHNLTSRRQNNHITTFKYDIHNNCIETCWKSEYSESNCNYCDFEYNKENQIVEKLESYGTRSNNRGIKVVNPIKKSYYQYDKLGRIVNDGEYVRFFNDKNQLSEVSSIDNKARYDKFLFYYDKYGLRIKETWIESCKDYNRISDTFFYYNDKGLLIEKKILNESNRLLKLERYEYRFN